MSLIDIPLIFFDFHPPFLLVRPLASALSYQGWLPPSQTARCDGQDGKLVYCFVVGSQAVLLWNVGLLCCREARLSPGLLYSRWVCPPFSPLPFPFRAFSRRFCPKRLTISTFVRRRCNNISLRVQYGCFLNRVQSNYNSQILPSNKKEMSSSRHFQDVCVWISDH